MTELAVQFNSTTTAAKGQKALFKLALNVCTLQKPQRTKQKCLYRVVLGLSSNFQVRVGRALGFDTGT